MEFYVILGLEPGASLADVKRAYRRLSRRYHPGVNPGDRAAEALFRRITEAFETLGDPDRRRQYDTGGHQASQGTGEQTFEFAGFDFSFAARGAQAATFGELFADVLHPHPSAERARAEAGADLYASLGVTFEESIQGIQRQVVVTRQVTCPPCGGLGQVRTAEGRCARCQATGNLRWARGHMVFSKACPSCDGTGRQRFRQCDVCDGHGRGVRTDAVVVTVHAGVMDGTRLRVEGEGHGGRLGGRAGDLYVDIRVQPHPTIRRDGDDLCMVVPVAVHEAVLGARIDVPTLDGTARLRVPPGTPAGRKFRVEGRGAPTPSGGRGDLVLEVQIVLPKIVDERSKELMREFGRLNSDDVRRGLQG